MKLMFWFATLAVVYVFFASFRGHDSVLPQRLGLRIDLAAMGSGEFRVLDWDGRPVIVYRRKPGEVLGLQQKDARLLDPESRRSDQPATATGPLRSTSSEWFVAIGLGTDLGCSLDLLPAVDVLFQQKSWQGGFIDSCRKGRYDLAGRVYQSQYAEKNLVVPAYHWSGTTLVLGSLKPAP